MLSSESAKMVGLAASPGIYAAKADVVLLRQSWNLFPYSPFTLLTPRDFGCRGSAA